MDAMFFTIRPIGVVRSDLCTRAGAPHQGYEGAPSAWLDIRPEVLEGLEGIQAGDEVVVITWLHEARRGTLKVHPRGTESLPARGVFSTRSPDRPNPVGLHRVTVLEVGREGLRVEPLEAIDGTPVIDIKPVLSRSADS